MNFRFRSAVSLFLLSLFAGQIVFAATLPSDVSEDAWYAGTVDLFTRENLIDEDTPFRPADNATRAEFVTLLVTVLGGLAMPSLQSFFSDVSSSDPFWHEFQEAAQTGLVRGAGNCVGTLPCAALPHAQINRAEAAALLMRSFDLTGEGDSPQFEDIVIGAWYEASIRAASSRCILRGDSRSDGRKFVRPEAHMNRAEMVVMMNRARQYLEYGVDCGVEDEPSKEEDRERPPRHPEDENPDPRTFELPAPETPTGVPLMRFDMSAHKVKDIVLTGLTFEAAQGSLLNAGNYSLWVDHNRDGTVETLLEKNVGPEDDVVSFQNFAGGGYVITTDTATFEVRATIAGSPQSNTLQLRIATGGIEAEELDGRVLSGIRKDGICSGRCQINQQTTPAEVLTILPHGNLFVSESSTQIRSRQLLGGTVTDPILQLTFRAEKEAIDVTELRLTSSGSLASSIDRLEFSKVNFPSMFAQASIGVCSGDDLTVQNPVDGSSIQNFCATLPTGTLRIAKDQRLDISVRARMKNDTQGGISGENIQLWLTGQAVSESTTGSGSIKARGVSSSERISANDGDGTAEGELFIGRDSAGTNQNIVGTLHTSVLAKISAVVNASADSANIPTGAQSIGMLRFEAATNVNTAGGANTITLDDILFTVSSTNVTLNASSFTVANTQDLSITTSCTPLDTNGNALTGSISGSFFVRCADLGSSLVSSDISSGGSLTLTLKGDITNPQVSSSAGSSLQLSLQNFTTPRTSFGTLGSHIHLIDRDANIETDLYWIDLPVTEVSSTLYRL